MTTFLGTSCVNETIFVGIPHSRVPPDAENGRPFITHGKNEIINMVTIFLMLCIGITLKGDAIMNWRTLQILLLGLAAFCCGTAGGLIFAKIMNLFSRHKVNPLIGAAGVSAVPMAARVAQDIAYHEDPDNHLLMHAMGPNVAGVIGSAIVAGYFLSVIK